MNPFLNSVEILKAVIRWKWHLIIIGLLSLVASVIFSGPAFIKPRFKSFAIVYPSNLIAYSTESATEQMLQMLQSSDVRKEVIDVFRLMPHYDIDAVKNSHAQTEVLAMYDENVNIRKTEFESVEIEVWDTDPQVAAAMADSIILFGDKKVRSLQREKAREVLVIATNQVNNKRAEIDSLEKLLLDYSQKYGLLEYTMQTKEYSRAYLSSLASGSSRASNEAKAMLEALAQHGETFNSLSQRLELLYKTLNEFKVAYDIALRDVSKELTYANEVTHPLVADKKSYPIRWLIVLISLGTSLFIGFFVLLLFGSKKSIAA